MLSFAPRNHLQFRAALPRLLGRARTLTVWVAARAATPGQGCGNFTCNNFSGCWRSYDAAIAELRAMADPRLESLIERLSRRHRERVAAITECLLLDCERLVRGLGCHSLVLDAVG
jgi:hypothetical protein